MVKYYYIIHSDALYYKAVTTKSPEVPTLTDCDVSKPYSPSSLINSGNDECPVMRV